MVLVTAVISRIVEHFGIWRLAFSAFLLAYTIILLMHLDYAPIQWDETPHLLGGLMLNRGQLSQYLQGYAFYPPLFDITEILYYTVFGVSVFSARLISVTFGVLSVAAVFEYTYRVYGSKNALISGVLLASMPGLIVMCRIALIETMVLFFFSMSLFLFYFWIQKDSNKLLVLTGLTLGLAFIAKYQALFSGVVMLVSIFLLYKKNLRRRFGKLVLIAVVALAVFLPWFLLVQQQFATDIIGRWAYAMQVGNDERTVYSGRFPQPIFYLIEMTYPYDHIHPISLPLYVIALLGLGLFAWKRREQDKFFLVWFVVVYVAFTFIPNKNWRYVTTLFPILAVSASSFILFAWDTVKDFLKKHKIGLHNPYLVKVAAAGFVVLIGASVVTSWGDAYSWVEQEHVYIPMKEATNYVSENSVLNESVIALFTGNFFSTDMIKFNLQTHEVGQREVWPYPLDAADSYKPSFNETELIEECNSSSVKYLLLYEHGNMTYFESDWKSYDVLDMLISSGSFTKEAEFGEYPRRITVIQFTPNQ